MEKIIGREKSYKAFFKSWLSKLSCTIFGSIDQNSLKFCNNVKTELQILKTICWEIGSRIMGRGKGEGEIQLQLSECQALWKLGHSVECVGRE
jgi:hypothetical protein